ncbi:hypothetical protein HPB48_001292 [Haemaphysalis longicornis]|uniref:Uncharacterized protein n=1 Tax=Haemaphysalis longicornis TaxID=44386 RepID=A0A9J6FN82_HAELO|nr:hypothetical protein HPB48_001292 [Haemaphysalis longicornis]
MVSAERRIPPVGCSQIPYDATAVMAGIEHLVKPERFVLMGPYDCEHIWMVRFTDAEARDAVVGAPDLKCAGQPAFCIEPLPEHSLHRGRCVGKGLDLARTFDFTSAELRCLSRGIAITPTCVAEPGSIPMPPPAMAAMALRGYDPDAMAWTETTASTTPENSSVPASPDISDRRTLHGRRAPQEA